jgi:mono/diheme cytochrome c family protein
VLFRTISTACLMLSLSAIGTACDDKKPEAKADAKGKAEEKKAEAKVEAKVEEAKVEAKVEEAKVEAKAEEAKVEEAKAEEAKAEDAKAEDAKAEDAKAVEAKVEEKKAVEAKVEEKKPAADPKKPAAEEPKADPGPSADGKGLYDKKCKNCHNSNGDGKTKIGAENDIEDWTVAGWKTKWTQQKVEDIVINGKSGSKMKPFKDKLTADEIVAVSKYARSLGK